MAKAPTYQELNRQRAENAATQSQVDQKASVAQEVGNMSTPNSVLADYMNKNKEPQGLSPRDPRMEYAAMSDSIAKSVPDQETYARTMVNAVMKGQVPAEAVMADAKIPDQVKAGLANQMRQSQGLGQLA